MQEIVQSYESEIRPRLTLPQHKPIPIPISGIYVLSRMLTGIQIDEIIGLKGLKCHHGDSDHGHEGTTDEEGEQETDDKNEQKKKSEKDKNKDKGTKTNSHHFRANKPHRLPWVSSLIWQHIPDIRIGNLRPYYVDDNMQLYRLREGAGFVSQHVDEDFDGPNQSIALYSILIYLNNSYTGGETIFYGTTPAPHIEIGGGLLFRHCIPHEGLLVQSGEKYILKTDLFFRG